MRTSTISANVKAFINWARAESVTVISCIKYCIKSQILNIETMNAMASNGTIKRKSESRSCFRRWH